MPKALDLNAAVSICLREPRSRTRQLLAANRRFIAALDKRRHASMGLLALRRYFSRFRFPQREQVTDLLSRDSRSRIIAAYHFGEYVYGMNYFTAQFTKLAEFAYLSLDRGSSEYFANLRLIFGERALPADRQYLARSTDSAQISRLLHSSRMNMVLFSDLPAAFGGKTIEVEFLQRPARFSCGVATLAVVNRVPLLPVVIFASSGYQHIYVASQLEPVTGPEETRSAVITRLTQALVDLLEYFFLRDPAQWRYLSALPQYLMEQQARET